MKILRNLVMTLGKHAWTKRRLYRVSRLVVPPLSPSLPSLLSSPPPPPLPPPLLALGRAFPFSRSNHPRQPPRAPCQPTSRGRFRFVRAGAAVHQSLLVPAPAFDGRVAAARSVIARL